LIAYLFIESNKYSHSKIRTPFNEENFQSAHDCNKSINHRKDQRKDYSDRNETEEKNVDKDGTRLPIQSKYLMV